MSEAVLIRVSGDDRPGITAGLMSVLADAGAEVYDVEQVALRGKLNLEVVLQMQEDRAMLKDVLFFGWENDLQIDFEVVTDAATKKESKQVVSLIGARVTPDAFGAAAAAIAKAGANIDRINRLARYPVVSYELAVSGGDVGQMRAALMGVAADYPIDVACQAERLERRAKRLVVVDVDSTLIQNEIVDLMAAEAGVVSEVSKLTDHAMAGHIDFTESLKQRTSLLAGLDEEALERVWEAVELTPGARTFFKTLRRMGTRTAIVSGGFSFFIDRLAERVGADHVIANELEIVNGRITGNLLGPVIDKTSKANALRAVADDEGIPLEQTVAVGDGANDLEMLAVAGLGIAFNARPDVAAAADTTLRVPYLDAVLFLLGIRGEDVDSTEEIPVIGLPPL